MIHFESVRQGAFFCVLGNFNYFSLVMSLGGENGRRPYGKRQISKLLQFCGVYICNKMRFTRKIKTRIPVVNKSMRLCCQAVMSGYVRQFRDTRVVRGGLDHASRKRNFFHNSRITRIALKRTKCFSPELTKLKRSSHGLRILKKRVEIFQIRRL